MDIAVAAEEDNDTEESPFKDAAAAVAANNAPAAGSRRGLDFMRQRGSNKQLYGKKMIASKNAGSHLDGKFICCSNYIVHVLIRIG